MSNPPPPIHPSIQFALVGAGHIGWRHAAQMQRCGILTAVADIVPEKAAHLAQAFGAVAYPSLDTLLSASQPDLVAICTPNYLHAAHSIRALESGCHVLCEKPMCLSGTEARAMIDTARQTERHLFVVKQNR